MNTDGRKDGDNTCLQMDVMSGKLKWLLIADTIKFHSSPMMAPGALATHRRRNLWERPWCRKCWRSRPQGARMLEKDSGGKAV
jgi:hypothetical protein